MRCWGKNEAGQLGYAHTNTIGDDETPASAGDVNVGGTVTYIAAGGSHTCALLSSGAVRCWGANFQGQLGYGNQEVIGDNEPPASAGYVNVGGAVRALALGGGHTCAILASGALRCWGMNYDGQLGYGEGDAIGDNELPSSVGDVPLGDAAVHVEASYAHTCVIVSSGAVRCWGNNNYGQLGYGHISTITNASAAPDVSL